MNVTLYGIPNCDQVKKARTWLSEHQVTVDFHDFKKAGVTPALISPWLKQLDWQILLNRRGTTWRKLPEAEQQAVIDADSAVQCMVNSPSVIKRPVLVIQTDMQVEIMVGFSEAEYRRWFTTQA
ncbi:ArsC family reductase [Solimicrobium silvestre]|uniref:Transcriptional regulator, Spx/MgsR family n=1 Tax=Solimicrobium silvestre TaxID=2099400 RepID=A0A2S9GUB4_9BURK|nr:ArsC family reductase [Solimicrobium silvestre]PRC91325.1 Transcriptional regulator, Spx/MgsR family [Solimicrobium silvestre]